MSDHSPALNLTGGAQWTGLKIWGLKTRDNLFPVPCRDLGHGLEDIREPQSGSTLSRVQ